jgi:hypothetical protein
MKADTYLKRLRNQARRFTNTCEQYACDISIRVHDIHDRERAAQKLRTLQAAMQDALRLAEKLPVLPPRDELQRSFTETLDKMSASLQALSDPLSELPDFPVEDEPNTCA